ncbi:MAG: GAF domain-containing protein [Anaerolineae bacterium]|nr:GAF domain-containing protein [Anaerolineae bacterium]
MIATIRRWMARIQLSYESPLERQQATVLTWMVLILLGAWGVSGLVFILPQIFSPDGLDGALFLSYLVVPGLLYGIHMAVQSANLRIAKYAFVGMLLVSVSLPITVNFASAAPFLLVIPLVAAGGLLNTRELSVYTVMTLVIVLIIAVNYSQETSTQAIFLTDDALGRLLVITLTSVIAALFLWLFNGGSARLIRDAVISVNRFGLLHEFGAMTAKTQDESDFLVMASTLLLEELRYEHVQFHLFDSVGNLRTYIRTGMGTRFSITPTDLHKREESALQVALSTRAPVLISLEDPSIRRFHMLPSSNTGMVIPINYSGHILGLLDIQSGRTRSPFNQNEQVLLRLVALEIATYLHYIRESNTARQVLQERDVTAERLGRQVTRLQAELEQSAGSDWRAYITGRGGQAFGFDMLRREDIELTTANDLPEALRPALERGELVIQKTAREQIVNVPIIFREEILGAMSFSVPLDRAVTERQKEMAHTVAQQLAVALENARLVEQSRAQAERERKASEVTNLLIAQQDIDLLLELAAESFNEALGAVYTQIHLEPETPATANEEVR